LQSASKLYRDGYHKVWSHTNFQLQDHADKPKSSKIKSGSCPLLMVWCLNDWYGCDSSTFMLNTNICLSQAGRTSSSPANSCPNWTNYLKWCLAFQLQSRRLVMLCLYLRVSTINKWRYWKSDILGLTQMNQLGLTV
jgi:hypothetical protein